MPIISKPLVLFDTFGVVDLVVVEVTGNNGIGRGVAGFVVTTGGRDEGRTSISTPLGVPPPVVLQRLILYIENLSQFTIFRFTMFQDEN